MNALRLLTPTLLLAGALTARASVSYSAAGSSYLQDFNSLPTDPPSNGSLQGTGAGQYVNGWADDSTTIAATQISLPGWYLYHPIAPASEAGSNGHQRFREGTGQNTGSFWAFASGGASDSEKALGSIGSTTVAGNGANMYMGLRLVNDTGLTLNSFTLSYDGEEWRDGQSASGETLLFAYSLTTSTADWINDANFTSVSALNFTSPTVSGTGSSGTAVDGNLAANRVAGITATISGISWAPGTELWLRWADPQLASNADDGLAIDNVNFTAIQSVPEPASLALLGIGAATLSVLRRKK
jgi:PEP-CTERM motif